MGTQAGRLNYSSIGKDVTYEGAALGEIREVSHDGDRTWITYLKNPEDSDRPLYGQLILFPDDLMELS